MCVLRERKVHIRKENVYGVLWSGAKGENK